MSNIYHEFMEAFNRRFAVKESGPALRRVAALREALTEIRDIAAVSEGVEFYAMLANKALERDDEEARQ
jgi:hypothetical protein